MPTPINFPRLRDDKQPHSSRVQDNVNATVAPFANAVNQTPMMGTAPVWVAFELAAAFANPTSASLLAQAAYYKDSFMLVRSKGAGITCAAGCAANTVIGSFPSGYRPRETQRKTVRGNAATYQSVSISPTGVVTCEVAIGAGGTIDLDFTFLAEQ